MQGSAIAYITARNKMTDSKLINTHANPLTKSVINKVTRRNFCLAGGLITIFPITAVTARTSVKEVIFAGVAQLGESKDLATIMPLTSDIMKKKTPKGQRFIDRAFKDALKDFPPENLNLVEPDHTTTKDSSLVLAAAINFEDTGYFVTAALGGKRNTYLFIELYGQALLVDLEKVKIVQSYPFRIYTAGMKVDGIINDEKLKNAFEDFVLGKNWVEGDPLSVVFAKKIQNLPFKYRGLGLQLQVQNISLENKAKKTLRSLSVDPDRYGNILGYTVSASLSEQLLFPVLPYKVERTIGGVMPTNFGNTKGANQLEIDLDQINYGVDVILRGFKKVVIDETEYSEKYVAAVYVRIIVRYIKRDIIIFDQKIKSQTPKSRRSLKNFDDTWNTYQQLAIRLFDNFSQTIRNPSVENITNKCHIKPSNIDIAVKEFKALKKAVDKCR